MVLFLSSSKIRDRAQPDSLVDEFRWKAVTAVGIGRGAHARDPAIGTDLRQLDSTVRPIRTACNPQ